MKKKVTINDIEYEIIKDVNEAIDKEVLTEKITDYFDNYDYIVGDWAYGKLRLKGFDDVKELTGRIYKKTLAEDEYYVMGDNRGGSSDSRDFGAIKKSEISY